MNLLKAVKLESLGHIQNLVKKQGVPFDANWTDYKSLNVALAYGKKDIAIFLLHQDCRVNKTKMSAHTTPLHNAVKLGDLQIVEELLKKGASVLALDSESNSPLHLAFIARQQSIVDLLLDNIQQNSNYINQVNYYDLSHLHIACTRNNVQVIQGYLDANASVEDVVNENSPLWAGFSAIHFAVNFRSLEALNILLKSDAKQIKNTSGETPLDLAFQNICHWMIMIDLLRDESSESGFNKKLSYFHMVCMNEDHKVVENFIQHGAKVNSVTPRDLLAYPSSSSLHYAVASRSKDKVKLLLEQGATINSVNSAKMTPLHLALYNENFLNQDTVEIVDMLYASVSDNDKTINRVDDNGLSYFHVAITRNDISTVKMFLDKGKVDVNQPLSHQAINFSHYTPLHLAVWYQYPKMVKLLVEHGADLNASNVQGTPLHMAFEAGDVDFVELFLRNGAKADLVVVDEKKTALHLLVIHCFYEVKSRRGDLLMGKEREILLYIEHLVKLGLDVNAKDKQGNTALHLVDPSRNGCAKYFQLLLDLGADVNLKNNHGMLPFKLDETQTERYKSEEYVVFYEHVQKLKILGLTIHPKNEETCQKITESGYFGEDELFGKHKQRLDEIVKLKAVKLDVVTTLFDFIKLDQTRAALFSRCKALKIVVEDLEIMEKYPLYGYLIRLQYQMHNLNNQKLCRFLDEEVAVKKQRCE